MDSPANNQLFKLYSAIRKVRDQRVMTDVGKIGKMYIAYSLKDTRHQNEVKQ